MHGLIFEENSFGANPGTKDLARHLYTRMSSGKVVIVAERPVVLISTLRKQWLKLLRKVMRERAGTLEITKINELAVVASQMQSLTFSIQWPPQRYSSDVYIATVDQLLEWAPDFRTMYVTCEMEREKLHLITALMQPNGLVVKCILRSEDEKTITRSSGEKAQE